MSYPVIFVHYGNPDYLKYTLLQAKEFNSEVILIGDETNNIYPFVTHYNITDYYENAAEFKKVYKHLSTRDIKYELFCFERWFIIENFMQKHNLQKCFYQDSDNMLYINVNDFSNKYYNDVPLVSFYSTGCNFFINSLDAFQKFCSFIKNHYSDENLFNELQVENNELQKVNNPGICDMYLFVRFTKQHTSIWKDLLEPTDDSFFCINILVLQEFENLVATYPKKKIYYIDGDFYCKKINSNKYFKCNNLQFQGVSKPYIPYFYRHSLKQQLIENSYFDYISKTWIRLD